MTKPIGKLRLHRETMRHLSIGTEAGSLLTYRCNTRNECPIESYAAACPTQRFDGSPDAR